MDKLQLKTKIIQRVGEIEDENVLKAINTLFNSSDENILKFFAFANEKNQQEQETEDFSDYIKEWVKSM